MNPIKVGRFIAELRKQKGLTQEQLAEKINVSNKTVSKWEVGINVPDTNCLFELSKVFNIPTQDILNGGEIQNNEENNDSIKNGINFYNRLFIKKVMRITLLIIIGFIAVFSILYTASNYNRVQVYDIMSLDDNFTINGYLIYNVEESIFMVDDIKYTGKDDIYSNSISYYKLSIKNSSQDLLYFIDEQYLDTHSDISTVLNKVKISFATNLNEYKSVNLENINSFYLSLIFKSEESITLNYKIKLNMKKHYANDKIMY